MYKRVLLKLSGEALGGSDGVFNIDMINAVAAEIKDLALTGVEVGVVVGGGNFVRGRTLEKVGFDRVNADYMGMMGTVMNAIALETVLNKLEVKAKAFSALGVATCEKYDIAKSRDYLKKGYVVIFGGGVGSPYFSTDTTSALRASENNCEVILMAKNGVDGVYSDDPQINKDAVKYDILTFDEVLAKNLKVIDATAASLCKDNKIEILVFDMKKPGNIKLSVADTSIGTVIKV